jgi:5-oxopent-3-ene-1,2,5-tricarboxylate decarboxylase / 2-hydroxyhepta-2,4-diene-1,7-dioate isomerase
MFLVVDHLLHADGEPLARDVDASVALDLIERHERFRAPVTGTVYGTLLNDREELAALGDAINAAPYKAPPKAPVLYVKPRNTLCGHGARVVVPHGTSGVQVGGSLGIVIGRTACRVSRSDAFDFVAGYTIVADLCVHHDLMYRPSVRYRARDGFCVVGPSVAAKRHVANVDDLQIRIQVNGVESCVGETARAVRSVAALLADVTDFMTLAPGDVLTMGAPHGAPNAKAGDRVTVEIGSLPSLNFSMIGPVAGDRQ